MKIEIDDKIVSAIDACHESKPDDPRPHLGVSMIGEKCGRKMWLSFRWAVRPYFPGRVLRLFRRGHQEEDNIISDLRAIGCDVRGVVNGRQLGVDFGSHVSGSLDAVIESGVPGALKSRHVAEFKTHSLKSFNDVQNKGVKASKPLHWAQMQCYMLGTEIDRALYVAVCKDDDRIYTERLELDKEAAQALVDRAKGIALSDKMPPPISTDPTWYECKFCDAYEFCHSTKLTKCVNCRTCLHSTAKEDSAFVCEIYESKIPVDAQREGCAKHVLHLDLVPWKVDYDQSTEEIAAFKIDGKIIKNGEKADGVFSSLELCNNATACLNLEPVAAEIRNTFDAIIEFELDDIPF